MNALLMQAYDFVMQSRIEFLATLFSLVYIILSLKQQISMWFFGLVAAILYVYVFFEAKFYADMSLQMYYVYISIFAWIKWRKNDQNNSALRTSRSSGRLWLIIAGVSVGIFLIYAFILNNTDTSVPYADAATTALGITATWMLAKKKIEHWLIWIAVDFFAVGLYFYKDLYFTSFLYLVYGILAIVGYFAWKRDLIKTESIAC